MIGKRFLFDAMMPRGEQQTNGPPTLMDLSGKFNTVHASGHIDIGKQKLHVFVLLEQRECLIRALGLEDREPGLFKDVDSVHANEHVVFHHENGRIGI